ncbi:hypothetical protein PROFUN_16786 [Planoprotostelium fungivorum]|uniref:C2H2-type domain-containing protein n=1 Tax=Planoprotostelium fungivorum TaxID=1890364 RepID=A0A2P6MNJ6_9EUKA|nr:hypothetical protein PROFUN_16786 [Planoprotostelium fungivorum]
MSNKRQQLHRRLKSAFTAIRFLIKLKHTNNLLSAVCISSNANMLKNKFCSAYFTGVIPFLFKIELNCTLVNIEDGSTINKTYLFPSDDDSVPDTKHRIHEFIAFKLKFAKSQQGVLLLLCMNFLVSKLYFKQCGQSTTDHVQVADLPAICQALNLDLTVYTLDSNLNSVKLYKSGNQGSAICLHIDQVKTHYMLLRTLVGYAETVICDKCKKVFAYSNSSKYHKHMAKHQKDQNSNKVLVFKDKPIQSSSTQYKQAFGTELVRPLFLAYDFEFMSL